MNKKSSIKNKFNKKMGKGFTLVELLAIVMVLSLIIGIVSGSIIVVLGNTKEKNYKTNIKNIENETVNYIVEYENNSLWNSIDSEKEYKCVSIQNLIDRGYFKRDLLDVEIANNRKVSINDMIYIVRNKTTKSIISEKLDYNGSTVCSETN